MDDCMALPVKASSEASEVKAQAPEAAQAEGKARPKSSGKKRRSKNSRNNETSTRNIEDPYQILKHPVTTEASLKELEANNTLTFVVDKRADKKMIRSAVEKLYDIRTKKVNTLMRPDGSKKAYVMCESNVAKKIGLFSSQ